MQFRFSVLILLSSISYVHPLAVAQQTQPNAPAVNSSTEAAETSESRVAPDAPVITIHGLCGNVLLPGDGADRSGSQAASSASDVSTTPNPNCETSITRQQFENLVRGVSARSDPRLGASFARDYPETLVFARKAIETGLDKDPAFQALLQYKYQQALYSIFKSYVRQKANSESEAELEKFYYANRDRYEQFGLLRIHVPDVREHHPAPGSHAQPKVDVAADQAAMKALAIKIRAEAVAGGNFEQLQAKAYKLAGETDDPPDTDLGDQWTRDTFPAENLAVVLALKPGQVSEPIHNASGWHIIKMVSRKTIPLSEARDSTLQLIVADEANSTRKAIKTELNDQYFVSAGSQQAKAPLK
jgi:parvulin-like peptidyl-prolyl isomerase